MWAVVDVETTGLYWRTVDRVVEIAVVQLDTDGREVDTWTTLIDPDRDVGATQIHGITAADLRGAPSFEQIAPDLLWRLSGRLPVGHNVRFDLAFLTNELGRLGMDLSDVEGVCTMEMSQGAGVGRALPECCSLLGVPLANHHSALEDARATAEIFRQLTADFDLCRPQPLPDWPTPPYAALVRSMSSALGYGAVVVD